MLFSVVVADAYPLMAKGMEKILSDLHYIGKISTCNTYTQLKKILTFQKPDILLLHAPLDTTDEYLLYQDIRNHNTVLKILLLSETSSPLEIKKLYNADLNGFLLRTAKQEELIEAIDVVVNNQRYVQEEVKAIIVNYSLKIKTPQQYITSITRREKEVLQLIVKEYTTKEIAKVLFISPGTVETHRLKLIQKLRVKNTAGLVREAITKQLID